MITGPFAGMLADGWKLRLEREIQGLPISASAFAIGLDDRDPGPGPDALRHATSERRRLERRLIRPHVRVTPTTSMDDLSQLFRLATEQQQSGINRLEATLRRILAQAPHESATRHRFAGALLRGQLDAAIDEPKLAIQFHPTSGAHSHLGSILAGWAARRAVASFQTAIELEPKNRFISTGNAYQQLGQFNDAVETALPLVGCGRSRYPSEPGTRP